MKSFVIALAAVTAGAVPHTKLRKNHHVHNHGGSKVVEGAHGKSGITSKKPKSRMSKLQKEDTVTFNNHGLLQHAPPVFVINLDDDSTRLNFVSGNLGQKAPFFQNACRMSAVDFRKCDKSLNKFVQAPGNALPTLGSGMSHRRAWEQIVDLKLPYGIVMEDDVHEFSKDFEKHFPTIFDPNGVEWDAFRLAIFPSTSQWVSHGQHKVADQCYFWRVQQHHMEDLHREKVRPGWGWGAAMYAISYEGAKKALARFNPTTDLVDSFSWADDVRCFLPGIATAGGVGTTRSDQKTPSFLEFHNKFNFSPSALFRGNGQVLPECSVMHPKSFNRPVTCDGISSGLGLPPVNSLGQQFPVAFWNSRLVEQAGFNFEQLSHWVQKTCSRHHDINTAYFFVSKILFFKHSLIELTHHDSQIQSFNIRVGFSRFNFLIFLFTSKNRFEQGMCEVIPQYLQQRVYDDQVKFGDRSNNRRSGRVLSQKKHR